MTVLKNPVFLAKTLKAQEAFSKARRMDDSDATAGQFMVADMLDMLAREIDAEREALK